MCGYGGSCNVANVLRDSICKTDTAARFGGDEFALLLCAIDSQEDANRVAQNILTKLSEIKLIDGKEIFITASIGIALYPLVSKHAEELIKNADLAYAFGELRVA